MILTKRLAIIVTCMLLGACASGMHITYRSDPPGASLYEGTKHLGYTPVTVMYGITEADRKAGVVYIQGTTVRWASGASAESPQLSATLHDGFLKEFTFHRPNVPGREIDVQVALKLQELEIQRQMARAQRDQAFNQYLQSVRPPPRQSYNCTSTLMGNMVQTNCY